MINSIILILLIVVTISLSGLFAGAETGMYQLSRLRLRLGVDKKKLSFITLDKALSDGPSLLLSILIGNNLANYITTSIITFMLLDTLQREHAAEILATVLAAPVLFVFCELLPKNIFFYRSDSLMPPIAPILYAFHKLFTFCGIVPLLKSISATFARWAGSPYASKTAMTASKQHQITALLKDTHEESLLSPIQTDIMNRLVNISNTTIKSVMTPINRVEKIEINSDNTALLKKLKQSPFTRLPVYERLLNNIVGFINIYDCLSSAKQFTDLLEFSTAIRELPADTTVLDAINIMQAENQKIVLVTKSTHLSRKGPVGIVTMKDLVEQLLGELAEW